MTVKCFEDNSRVKSLLNSDGKDKDGNGKVLVVDGGGSMRCALLGDMIAQSAIDNGWAGLSCTAASVMLMIWQQWTSVLWRLVAFHVNRIAAMKVKPILKLALVI